MVPNYEFILNGTVVHPLYPGCARTHKKEDGYNFYREELDGNLIFYGNDFDLINEYPFDERLYLTIRLIQDGTSSDFIKCQFTKTDCEMNLDSKTCTVRPEVDDVYKSILDKYDNTVNIAESLNPSSIPVRITDRAIFQVATYSTWQDTPGNTVRSGLYNKLSNYLGSMQWESDLGTTNFDDLPNYGFNNVNTDEAGTSNQLTLLTYVNMLSFPPIVIWPIGGVYQNTTPKGTGIFSGSVNPLTNIEIRTGEVETPGTLAVNFYNTVTNTYYWGRAIEDGPKVRNRVVGYGYDIPLSDSSDVIIASVRTVQFRACYRILCDKQIGDTSSTAMERPQNDVSNVAAAYRWIYRPTLPKNSFYYSVQSQRQPTKWGENDSGGYFVKPEFSDNRAIYPLMQSMWPGFMTYWFTPSNSFRTTIKNADSGRTIRNNFALSSVIKQFVNSYSENVTHGYGAEYSEFLYGVNPIDRTKGIQVLTPKTNIYQRDYDFPQSIAELSMQNLFQGLKDTFRLGWYIDDQNRFRVEHERFFYNGLSYSPNQNIGIDLTKMINPKNGLPWSFGRNQWTYNKEDMPARYECSYGEESYTAFNGTPIDIISPTVQEDAKEEILVTAFTGDIDYLSGASIDSGNKDGFALIDCNFRKVDVDVAGQNNHYVNGEGVITPYQGRSYAGYYLNLAMGNLSEGFIIDYKPIVGIPAVIWYSFQSGVGNILLSTSLIGTNDSEAGLKYLVPPNSATYMHVNSLMSTPNLIYEIPTAKIGNINIDGADIEIQNYRLSYPYLHENFWRDNMPARNLIINNDETTAFSIKRTRQQEVKVPNALNIQPMTLIRTGIGNGEIEEESTDMTSLVSTVTVNFEP